MLDPITSNLYPRVMKVVVLYRPKSEHARQLEEFLHDFQRENSDRKLDLIDVDTPVGTTKAELYDAVQYPAVLALTNDGQLLKMWQGQLPLMNELAYYTTA